MKKCFKLLLPILFFMSMSASAEVMHYSLCTLNDGKSLGDVQAWIDDWRKLAKQEKIEYELRLLVGHVGIKEQMPPNFYLEGSTPTLGTHAAAWQWWYNDEDAGKSFAQLQSIATCGTNTIFTTTE
jgi:hypothetical protein